MNHYSPNFGVKGISTPLKNCNNVNKAKEMSWDKRKKVLHYHFIN